MKTTIIYLMSLALLFSACAEEQEAKENSNDNEEHVEVDLRFPALSPRAEVMQTIGITKATINYSRPYVREREIWGKLVPYDELWRTGADATTTISFDNNVLIEGNALDAGTYALFTIPREDDNWTVIFNTETAWGVSGYDEENDALRIDVPAGDSDRFRELMTFSFEDVTDRSAHVKLAWENLSVTFEIETETHKQVIERIEKAIAHADEDDWAVYSNSARYLIRQEKDLDQAEEWLEKSLTIDENWRNTFVKAYLNEAKGKIEEAVKLYEKALELGHEHEDPFGAAGFLEGNIERLKEKL